MEARVGLRPVGNSGASGHRLDVRAAAAADCGRGFLCRRKIAVPSAVARRSHGNSAARWMDVAHSNHRKASWDTRSRWGSWTRPVFRVGRRFESNSRGAGGRPQIAASLLRRHPAGHHCLGRKCAPAGDDVGHFLRGLDSTGLYQKGNNPVPSTNGSEPLKEGLDKVAEFADQLRSTGSELAEGLAAKAGEATLPSRPSEAFAEELNGLRQLASTVSSKGSEGLDRVAELGDQLRSKGSELAEGLAAEAGEATLPSRPSEVFGEELNGLRQLVSTVSSKGSEGLDRVAELGDQLRNKGSELAEGLAAKAGEATLPSRPSEVFGEELDGLRQLVSTVSSKGSEGLDRVAELGDQLRSKGSELAEGLAAKAGDATLPSRPSEVVPEELNGLRQLAFTVSSKGSDILDSLVAKSGESANVLSPYVERLSGALSGLVAKSGELVSQTFHLPIDSRPNGVLSPSVEALSGALSGLVAGAGALASELESKVTHFTGDVIHLDAAAVWRPAGQLVLDMGAAAVGAYDGLGPYAGPVSAAAFVAVAGSGFFVGSSKAPGNDRMFVEGEDLPLRYDPAAIGLYFQRRPADTLARSLKIMVECSALTVSILSDASRGKARENERRRAAQLVDLISRLGPTAIKIGQALSIRPDILPVAYLEELQKLQDKVPPFPNEEAKELIVLGLGRSAEEVYSKMSEFPVAAASLGQVYKGKLRETGEVVAIKVQRPGVLEGISRDLFLLRSAAYALQLIPMIHSDLIALLDTWAVRFFDELDYEQEGRNAEQFADNMRALGNITVPSVYMRHTSRKVLTTQWIEGEKLSESRADDLLPLVSTALNCYLTQLLESGFLHADPHPGNLLRTPDGRLCILDFGLMTQVTQDQRYALIDYIAHLVNSDYGKVAEDLVKLGFVPPGMEDPEKTAALVPQLTRVLGQLVQGGGARKINVQQVTDDLANMSKDYVFVLPPYFALILRAFSVLEGIGLEADQDYSIVSECYPYIAKRLLTDDSPRARGALKDFLYGGKTQLDVRRVEQMFGGFQSFRDLMVPAGSDTKSLRQKSRGPDATTREALTVMFAPEGSYVQELLLTELVRSVDALSREALAELWQLVAAAMRLPGLPVPAPFSVPAGSWPLPVPGLFFMFGMTTPVARLSQEDEQSLDNVRRIWRLVQPSVALPSSPSEMLEVVRDAVPLMWDLLPGVTTAARRFSAMLLRRLALRLADDLDGTNSVTEWNNNPAASARHVRPKWPFTAASEDEHERYREILP